VRKECAVVEPMWNGERRTNTVDQTAVLIGPAGSRC
jgi:hypothetical protein